MRAGRDRAEGEVDERILVAGPPVRQLLGAGINLEAKAAGLRRHRSRRIFQLRRHHRHVGRCGEPLAGTIRWQPELRACLVHGGRGELDRLCFRPREPEADAENRDPMALREKFGAELPALAHDHVRVPALDEITEGGQLGANVEPGEELLIITRCALSMSNSANPPISGIHSSREGSSTGANGRPRRSTLPPN